MLPPLPRTVIIDYYDSYTNNILILFTQLYSDAEVLKKVVVVKADKYNWSTFRADVLPNVDCVILSPGPGRPDNPSDIGFALELLRESALPILGVCLGHQAIGVAFGAKIVNTPRITHGHVVSVVPVLPPKGPFASTFWQHDEAGNAFDAVVYNSLVVDPETIPEELEITAWSDPRNGSEPTIQGLAHRSRPVWGVQYHPESISSTRGSDLLGAFVHAVHVHHGRPPVYPRLDSHILTACTYRITSAATTRPGTPTTRPGTPSTVPVPLPRLRLVEKRLGHLGRDVDTARIFETLIRNRKTQSLSVGDVWLDGKSSRPTTTSLASPTFVMTYSLATRTVYLYTPSAQPFTLELPAGETFWSWFNVGHSTLTDRTTGDAGGWRGGWVGWFTYEMKAESLAGYRGHAIEEARTDAVWAWSDRLIERADDGEWVVRGVVASNISNAAPREATDMLGWLQQCGVSFGVSETEFETLGVDLTTAISNPLGSTTIPASSFPSFSSRVPGETHRKRIDECREAIRQGESYELNQTTSFISNLPPDSDPYQLYLRLRTFNPAYYSTFISFPDLPTPHGKGLHVLSSSPERFLQIRGDEIEMRPIKGTRARVLPGQCVCIQGHGCEGLDKGSERCVAEGKLEDERRGKELSEDVKERAENLMIVDLIRSDLLSCCIPSTVIVPQLIALESYGVHNLVTTVSGQLAPNVGAVEAVKRCFPPGSMTGAPKLRSVQLLEEFEEHHPRGIYSGTLGYISLCGSVDLSVVIRTIILAGDQLSIGAGGAITWLSDRNEEWEEVLTKVRSVVGPLQGI